MYPCGILVLLKSLDLGAARSVDSLTCCDSPIVDQCCSTLATILNEVTEIRTNAAEKFFPPLLLYESCGNIGAGYSRSMSSDPKHVRVLLGPSRSLQLPLQSGAALPQSPVSDQRLSQFRALLIESFFVPGLGLETYFLSFFKLTKLSKVGRLFEMTGTSTAAVVKFSTIGTAQHNPAQFGVSGDDLRSLIAAIATVEEQVMAGNGLRNCYEQSYGEIDDDKQFASRMRAVIVEMYNQWEKAADGDMPDKHRLMVIISLFVFFHLHFPTKDTKLPKLIWKSHKKIVAFHLVGDILWIPCEFLMREIPSIVSAVDKKSVQFIRHLRETFYVEHCDGMLEEAVSHISAADEWQFKIVAFHLVGDILWIPCEFLMREIPSIVSAVDKKSVQFIRHLRETFYVEHCDGMLEEAVSHISAADDWQFKVSIAHFFYNEPTKFRNIIVLFLTSLLPMHKTEANFTLSLA
ncbi:hypothetical protein OESDEN_10279 [Oesophagostomum dentatum]|uniref:WASH complex subunit 4 N-terminal domain-containing protein n=1 Tax=Oesophagostomum dentatum TaxID=61180 RepID=A0A0B1T263_OESDE|nr:hypothetical protein OESDEN_10279 [Oesophagostomum dentatum]